MPDGQPPDDPIIRLEQVRKQKRAPQDNNPEAALDGTEDAVALEFSRRLAEQLRYVNPWRKWLRWDGARWFVVETLWVFHQVRLIAREYAKIHNDKKLGKDAATAAIERCARNDPKHDTPSDVWDLNYAFFNEKT
jgi:putative DNA primase/helicase